MGKVIVTLISEEKVEEARQWESKVFQQVCVQGSGKRVHIWEC